MAKREPLVSLAEMEQTLGYKVAGSTYLNETTQRFYSDLSPVSQSAYKKTRKEVDEYLRNRRRHDLAPALERALPEPGVIQVGGLWPFIDSILILTLSQKIVTSEDAVVLERRSLVGHYTFTAGIDYGFGLHLPLQLTKNEALATMSVAKVIISY